MRPLDWDAVQSRLLPERGAALRVATLILGRRQLAEDAVQEAYIRAARGVHGVRDPEALAAWFRRIVAHEALRLARRHGREEALPEAEPAGRAPGAEEQAQEAEERAQARRAVASLSPPLRAAVALPYGLGLPVAETAAILGVPPGTVKSRCAAARGLLRPRMDRPLREVVEMAVEHVRLVSGAEIESMNREWRASGQPEARPATEDEVRALFPEVGWPGTEVVGLPFHSGRLLQQPPRLRLGWAWYGEPSNPLMVGLSATPEHWHTNIHDDSAEAVVTETVVAGAPAVWVARPDGVHYLQFACRGVQVGLAGRFPPDRLRGLAQQTLAGR